MKNELSINDQAAVCFFLGKYVQAEGLYKWNLITKQETFGPHHLEVAYCVNNLAAVYDAEERFSESEKLYMEALTIITESDELNDFDFRMAIFNFVDCCRMQGDTITARTVLEGLWPKSTGDKHRSPVVKSEILNSLALVSKAEGKLDEAEDLFKQALAIAPKSGQIIYSESTHVISYSSTPTYLNNLGALYLTQKRYSEAEECCVKALKMMESEYGANNLFLKAPLSNLIEIYSAQGKNDELERIRQRFNGLPSGKSFTSRQVRANDLIAVNKTIDNLKGSDFKPDTNNLPYRMNNPTNPMQQRNEKKPLNQWSKMNSTCSNKGNSNVVDIEINYDLNSMWDAVMKDSSINLRCFQSRNRIHEVTYFWVSIYSDENKTYVRGNEGDGQQYIGGYYWGLFAKKDGTPLRARLTVPQRYGPGRYHIEVKTRLGTWDYAWFSEWQPSSYAKFLIDNFVSSLDRR
jgi:hypothetical protein